MNGGTCDVCHDKKPLALFHGMSLGLGIIEDICPDCARYICGRRWKNGEKADRAEANPLQHRDDKGKSASGFALIDELQRDEKDGNSPAPTPDFRPRHSLDDSLRFINKALEQTPLDEDGLKAAAAPVTLRNMRYALENLRGDLMGEIMALQASIGQLQVAALRDAVRADGSHSRSSPAAPEEDPRR